MAEVRQLLRAKARERGVRLDILEKDYALSYLLAALSEIPAFDAVVLKGGTALIAPFLTQPVSVDQVLSDLQMLIPALWR